MQLSAQGEGNGDGWRTSLSQKRQCRAGQPRSSLPVPTLIPVPFSHPGRVPCPGQPQPQHSPLPRQAPAAPPAPPSHQHTSPHSPPRPVPPTGTPLPQGAGGRDCKDCKDTSWLCATEKQRRRNRRSAEQLGCSVGTSAGALGLPTSPTLQPCSLASHPRPLAFSPAFVAQGRGPRGS